MAKTKQLTAVIIRKGEWYAALCPLLSVTSHGKTVEEARRNLIGAVELFIRTADSHEMECGLSSEVYVTGVEVKAR